MTYTPCNDCPFRSDRPPLQLGTDRRREIVLSILGDSLFSCHKTTVFDDEGNHVYTPEERPCIGAAVFIQENRKTCLVNIAFRLAKKRGVFDDRKLPVNAAIVTDPFEFIHKEEESSISIQAE